MTQPAPPAYSTKEAVTPPVDLVSRESDGLPAPAQPDEQEIVLENTLVTKSELVNEVDNGENTELSAHERNSDVHFCILHWMLLLAAGVLALYGVLYHNKDKKDKMSSSR